jgi:hypothetical protein
MERRRTSFCLSHILSTPKTVGYDLHLELHSKRDFKRIFEKFIFRAKGFCGYAEKINGTRGEEKR